MAQQPFSPSTYPDGERQLDVARSHVKKLLKNDSSHLDDSAVSQLHAIQDAIAAALDAEDAETRLDAIDDARTCANDLASNDALNPTLTSGVRRRVNGLLDKAEERVSDD